MTSRKQGRKLREMGRTLKDRRRNNSKRKFGWKMLRLVEVKLYLGTRHHFFRGLLKKLIFRSVSTREKILNKKMKACIFFVSLLFAKMNSLKAWMSMFSQSEATITLNTTKK